MAVTMDPKPDTLRENVILKFKNLKVTYACCIIHKFKLHFMPHQERLTKSCLQCVVVIVVLAFV